MNSMKIVAYALYGQDNNTVMFKDTEAKPLCPVSTALLLPDERKALYDNTTRGSEMPSTCPSCGWRLDFQAHNPNYKLRSTKSDITGTYDGQIIVSRKFRDFCEQEKYQGLRLLPFINDDNHFHLIVDNTVNFDFIRGGTVFNQYCDICKNYESIIGSIPAFLKVIQSLEDGFYRSDILFAHGNEKHPLLLVGIDTKKKLKAAGLKGMDFHPAYGL